MTMTLQKPDTQTQAYVEPDQDFGYLLATAGELDVPDGFNAEVFGGNIVVSPWSRWGDFELLHALTRQIGAHAPEGHVVGAEPFKFAFPDLEGGFGPDAYVLDPDMVDDDSTTAPCESLSLVAELTSTATRARDIGGKLDIYGRSGVPVYRSST